MTPPREIKSRPHHQLVDGLKTQMRRIYYLRMTGNHIIGSTPGGLVGVAVGVGVSVGVGVTVGVLVGVGVSVGVGVGVGVSVGVGVGVGISK